MTRTNTKRHESHRDFFFRPPLGSLKPSPLFQVAAAAGSELCTKLDLYWFWKYSFMHEARPPRTPDCACRNAAVVFAFETGLLLKLKSDVGLAMPAAGALRKCVRSLNCNWGQSYFEAWSTIADYTTERRERTWADGLHRPVWQCIILWNRKSGFEF